MRYIHEDDETMQKLGLLKGTNGNSGVMINIQ